MVGARRGAEGRRCETADVFYLNTVACILADRKKAGRGNKECAPRPHRETKKNESVTSDVCFSNQGRAPEDKGWDMEGHRCGTEDASNEEATGKATSRLHALPDMGKDDEIVQHEPTPAKQGKSSQDGGCAPGP